MSEDENDSMRESTITPAWYATIDYYTEKRYYSHVKKHCTTHLAENPQDVQLRFWKAMSLQGEGNTAEAIKLLNKIKRDVIDGSEKTEDYGKYGMAVCAALVHCLKSQSVTDNEALDGVKKAVKKVQRQSDADSMALAARFFLHTNKQVKARQCIGKLLSSDEHKTNIGLITLFGWICLKSDVAKHQATSSEMFKKALKRCPSRRLDPAALLGRARYYELEGDIERALRDTKKLCELYPTFVPGLEERARFYMLKGRWAEACKASEKALSVSVSSIAAHKILLLHHFLMDGQLGSAFGLLKDTAHTLNDFEPNHPVLYYGTAKLAARLSRESTQFIELCGELIDRAVDLDPYNSSYKVELGYQDYLVGEYGRAMDSLDDALRSDPTNSDAQILQIRCLVGLQKLSSAKQRLQQISASSVDGKSKEMFLLCKAICSTFAEPPRRVEAKLYLKEAVERHSSWLLETPQGRRGPAFYEEMDPHFIVEAASLLLELWNQGADCWELNPVEADGLSEVVLLALEQMTTAVPGNIDLHLLRAKIFRSTSEFAQCETCLEIVNELHPGHPALRRFQAMIEGQDPADLPPPSPLHIEASSIEEEKTKEYIGFRFGVRPPSPPPPKGFSGTTTAFHRARASSQNKDSVAPEVVDLLQEHSSDDGFDDEGELPLGGDSSADDDLADNKRESTEAEDMKAWEEEQGRLARWNETQRQEKEDWLAKRRRNEQEQERQDARDREIAAQVKRGKKEREERERQEADLARQRRAIEQVFVSPDKITKVDPSTNPVKTPVMSPRGSNFGPNRHGKSKFWEGQSEASIRAQVQKEQIMEQNQLMIILKAFAKKAFWGEIFLKHGRRGLPHERNVSVKVVDDFHIQVDWASQSLKATKNDIQVVEGKQTPVMNRGRAKNADPTRCFSIVTSSRSVDLQARTPQIRDTWVQGLRLLISTLALLPQSNGAPASAARSGWNQG